MTVYDIYPEKQSEQFRIDRTVSSRGIGCAFVVKLRCRDLEMEIAVEFKIPAHPSCGSQQHLNRINLLNYCIFFTWSFVTIRGKFQSITFLLSVCLSECIREAPLEGFSRNLILETSPKIC